MTATTTSKSKGRTKPNDLPSGVESSQQLALSLFAELAPADLNIDQAPDSIGFQRNNIFVDIADLSLSARRAIDVAYFIAAESPEIQVTYTADLNYFKWLMAYGSNNRKHLRQVLREGQKAAIEVEDMDSEKGENDQWVSVPLLGPVGLARGKIVYEIPRQLQPHIKNPESSHFLSLRYVFKNLYAKILYDKLLPHLEVGVTPWVSIEELRQWFCLDAGSYTEFKRLSERTLKPSVVQIEKVTGLAVSFTTRNIPGSKKVADVSFRIQAPRTIDAVKSPMVVQKEIYNLLRDEFGLNGTQIMEIINNREEWTDERIQRAIEYTRFHIGQGKVKLPAGYLMKAIRGDYTLGEAMKTIANQQAAAAQGRQLAAAKAQASIDETRATEEEKRRKTAEAGYKTFEQMTPESQESLLNNFVDSSSSKVLARRMKIDPVELKDVYQSNPEVRELLGTFVSIQAKKQQSSKASQIAYEAFEHMSPDQQSTVLKSFIDSSGSKALARRMKVDPVDLMDLYQENIEVRELLGTFIADQAKRQPQQRGLVDQ